MNPTAKNNTRKKIVLPLFCYLYPTESHLLDPKSHQEHRHIHTDACSYTECALNGKIAYLTFRNHEIYDSAKKIIPECILSILRNILSTHENKYVYSIMVCKTLWASPTRSLGVSLLFTLFYTFSFSDISTFTKE